ncbi:hypothetical protein C9374_006550 [Naegleria lovaniensis]|uniref:Nucleotidyltransferase n=1 Tax=Naegleria lovaniensis TaxID=51637 RepID=A0AA88GNA4_NAELO|nr:uncharacterized protein C9374_006550 [Naegleria lovaniensis]KAG2379433.1 hypothetical protein C9374_006550 [Naegleria lovaniensis]
MSCLLECTLPNSDNNQDNTTTLAIQHEIFKQVQSMEEEHGITILMVSDVGSRAYNWEQPLQSDFDLNFIYTRDWKYYITIQNKQQTIKKETHIELERNVLLKRSKSRHSFYCHHDDQQDINLLNHDDNTESSKKLKIECNFLGYDVKYAADLLYKSNRAIVFALLSPCVYYMHPRSVDMFSKWISMCHAHVQRRHHLHEMIHIARYNINRYVIGRRSVRVKAYLYILHHLFYALYMYKRRNDLQIFNSRLPPLQFTELLNDLKEDYLSPTLVHIVEFLMKLKVNGEQFSHLAKLAQPKVDASQPKKEEIDTTASGASSTGQNEDKLTRDQVNTGVSENGTGDIKQSTNKGEEEQQESNALQPKKQSKKQQKKQAKALADEKLSLMEDDNAKNDVYIGHSLHVELFTVFWYRKLAAWIWDLPKDVMNGDQVDSLLLEAVQLFEEKGDTLTHSK